jgi:hypothetical protein
MHLDPEAGARVLFDETFQGTLPVLSTWSEQPEDLKTNFRRKALAVACAAVVFDAGDLMITPRT